jgi:ERCC4-type nuclease
LLVAPTEPEELRAIGVTSLIPERFGVDVMFGSTLGLIGIQRKTVTDFLASLHDGRLQKELFQMQRLCVRVFILEGLLKWTEDRLGLLVGVNQIRWSRAQHLSVLWSIQSRGIWVTQTDSLRDTVDTIWELRRWAGKTKHDSLLHRPGPASSPGVWGKPDCRDYAIWVLQGFDGIGPELAGRIFDHCDGLPLRWTLDAKEMQEIRGIGAGKAGALMEMLDSPEPEA